VPPLVSASVALRLAALPDTLIPQVPVAPVPAKAGTPRAVRAFAAVVDPVPPLATANVPARVRVPEVVIGPPEKERPVVPPAASTLVTAPPPVAAIVIVPVPFVTVIPAPAVRVALDRVFPVVFPISSWPFV